MKKLLIVATLSIAVAAVIKRVTRKKSLNGLKITFTNADELEYLKDDVIYHSEGLENAITAFNKYRPKFELRDTIS